MRRRKRRRRFVAPRPGTTLSHLVKTRVETAPLGAVYAHTFSNPISLSDSHFIQIG
jgi:hypothetical protein